MFDRAFNTAAAAANLEVEKEEAALRALEPKVRTQVSDVHHLTAVKLLFQLEHIP